MHDEKLSEEQINKINDIKDRMIRKEIIDNTEIEELLKDIFNKNDMFKEVLIPMSFFYTEYGNILLNALCKSDYNEELTISDIIQELGVSKQYISKCLNTGKMKGKLKGGIWEVKRSEVERFKAMRKNK